MASDDGERVRGWLGGCAELPIVTDPLTTARRLLVLHRVTAVSLQPGASGRRYARAQEEAARARLARSRDRYDPSILMVLLVAGPWLLIVVLLQLLVGGQLLPSVCAAAGTTIPVRTALPTTMEAMVASKAMPKGDLSALGLQRDAKVPTPRHGQALIQVRASSVNPVDWKIIETGGGFGVFRFPHVIGFDLAGTVVACPGCRRVKVGDDVWADNGEFWPLRGGELGAYAQYALSDETQVALKPPNLNWEEAATLPLVGLTSLQALQETGAPWAGLKAPQVLITSGAGGTGFVAVQMAKAWGANVTAVGRCTFFQTHGILPAPILTV